MNATQKIDKLKSDIILLEREISNCHHEFYKPKYEPETIKVQDTNAGYEHHGVDMWPKLSFHDETKSRWSRECSKCGKVEYTYKQEPVITHHEPKF